MDDTVRRIRNAYGRKNPAGTSAVYGEMDGSDVLSLESYDRTGAWLGFGECSLLVIIVV